MRLHTDSQYVQQGMQSWMKGWLARGWKTAANKPVLMASAMKKAVEAGREAFLAGRMPKKLYASASSPLSGTIN